MSLPSLHDVSQSTFWYMSEADLASAHADLHNLWDLGDHSDLISVIHGWLVKELAARSMSHPWKSELDDGEETFDEPFDNPWEDAPWAFEKSLRVPDGAPAWAKAIAADPIDGGWNPETGRFSWFDEATKDLAFDVVKSMSVRWPEPDSAEERAEWQLRWAVEVGTVQDLTAGGITGPSMTELAQVMGAPTTPILLTLEKSVWGAEYKAALPDEAFLSITADGRSFPVRRKDGSVDRPHLRHALATLPESGLADIEIRKALRKGRRIAREIGLDLRKSARTPDPRPSSAGRTPAPGRSAAPTPELPVVPLTLRKDLGAEKRIATGPVIIPETTDGHGDRFTVEAVENAAGSFLSNYRTATKMGVEHQMFPPGIDLWESWVTKSAWTVGDRTFPEGTWMMSVRLDESRWADVKAGRLRGFSPGGKGKGYYLDEVAA